MFQVGAESVQIDLRRSSHTQSLTPMQLNTDTCESTAANGRADARLPLPNGTAARYLSQNRNTNSGHSPGSEFEPPIGCAVCRVSLSEN